MIKNLLLATCCTAAVFLGCAPAPVDPAVAPKAATITAFSANPASLPQAGSSVTLTWTSTEATSISLEHVGVGPVPGVAFNGSTEVTLDRDGTFALTAQGEGGSDTRFVTVRVEGGGAAAAFFTAIPKAIRAGSKTSLVWNVPGATALTIRPEASGAALDLGGQVESGSVELSPSATTEYVLEAGTVTAKTTVAVGPAIFSFSLDGDAPVAGQPVKLKWTAGGASSLALFRQGESTPLTTIADPAQIAAGTFSDPTSGVLSANATLGYRLVATEGALSAESRVSLRVAGALRIADFVVPRFTRPPTPTTVDWTTVGAEALEVLVDGVPYYRAPTLALIAAHGIALPTPAAERTVELVVSNSRGERLRRVLRNAPVGAVAQAAATFTADTAAIATGGAPVLLTWNVPEGRRVRVSDSTGRVLAFREGPEVGAGTVTVLPNAPTVTYTLDADNGTPTPAFTGAVNGDGITPLTVAVTVAAPAVLRFDAQLPAGNTVNVTGSSLASNPAIIGLAGQTKNNGTDAFIDIAASGTEVELLAATDTAAALVVLPDVFNTRLAGRAVGGRTFSIASNGFIAFSSAPVTGPMEPALLTAMGVNAVGGYFADLELARTRAAFWRLDAVGKDPRLIVQWEQAHLFDSPLSKLTFQVQVYGSGKVVVAFKTFEVPSPVPNLVPTIGLVGTPTTRNLQVPAVDVASGDVFTLQTPALPQPFTTEATPFLVGAEVPAGVLDIAGDGAVKPGVFGLTEVNPRPAPGIDGGEWLEVTNFSADPVNLKGWTLGFGGANTHLIPSDLIIPPSGRALLAQSATLGVAAGPATYVYPATLALPDGTGAVTLAFGTSPAYSRIAWDAALIPDAGIALQSDRVAPSQLYRTGVGQSTCPAQGAESYGTPGQAGTPGAANFGKCLPYVLSPLPTAGFASIAATGASVGLVTPFDNTIVTLALPTPVRLFGVPVSSLQVDSNGWLSPVPASTSVSFNKTLPSGSNPLGTVAPFWDDLASNLASTDGGYGAVGVFFLQANPDGLPDTGDETTTISWENLRQASSAGTVLNFQVKFLANGDLEFHYGNLSGNLTTAKGSSATSWLEDRFGTSALPINVNSASAPGISANTSFRFAYTP